MIPAALSLHADFLLDAGAMLVDHLKDELASAMVRLEEERTQVKALQAQCEDQYARYADLEKYADNLKAVNRKADEDVGQLKVNLIKASQGMEKRVETICERAEAERADLNRQLTIARAQLRAAWAALEEMHRLVDRLHMAACKRRKQKPVPHPGAHQIATDAGAPHVKRVAGEAANIQSAATIETRT